MDFDSAELVHHIAENAGDVIFEDEFLLLHALEQLAAQAVHGLALLVHDVVVLEQMFAGLEVLGFDRLLRGVDAARDQPRFDGNALFHAQPLQQVRNPLFGEDAHQVIFEREIEARRAGIALATGAAAKLVVDPPRFVAFGAENVQAADRGDFVVFLVGLRLVAIEYFGPLVGGDDVLVSGVVPDRALGLVHIDLNLALGGAQRLRNSLLHALLLGHEFGIAAEQNVGAAAGHVGGDGDHAFASGLGHDLGFALVILGVEHDVLDALLLQQLRQAAPIFRSKWCRPARDGPCHTASGFRPRRRNTFLFPFDRRRPDFPPAASILLVGITMTSRR